MPIVTTLGQRCTVFLDIDGVQRFKISSSIDAVLAGDLPIFGPSPYTSNIFVHKIVSPTDPKADTFLRVGNVADLTTLPLGRELAVGLGQTLYLTTEFTVIYDDIATASQAKTLIQQRVDNLIADWHTYNEKFLAPLTTPPNLSSIPLPLTLSEETARKDAYNTAHAELLSAKVDSAAAAATSTASLTSAAAANEAAANAILNSQQCSTTLGQLNTGITAMDSYRSSVNIFMTASRTFQTASAVYIALGASPGLTALSVFTAAKTTYDAAVIAMQSAVSAEISLGQPTLDALHTSMATACTGKIADVNVAASKKTDADKAAAEATTAKKAADEATSAALIADTQAYLSVKELCPDFQPTVP